jgi:hypothetical protein
MNLSPSSSYNKNLTTSPLSAGKDQGPNHETTPNAVTPAVLDVTGRVRGAAGGCCGLNWKVHILRLLSFSAFTAGVWTALAAAGIVAGGVGSGGIGFVVAGVLIIVGAAVAYLARVTRQKEESEAYHQSNHGTNYVENSGHKPPVSSSISTSNLSTSNQHIPQGVPVPIPSPQLIASDEDGTPVYGRKLPPPQENSISIPFQDDQWQWFNQIMINNLVNNSENDRALYRQWLTFAITNYQVNNKNDVPSNKLRILTRQSISYTSSSNQDLRYDNYKFPKIGMPPNSITMVDKPNQNDPVTPHLEKLATSTKPTELIDKEKAKKPEAPKKLLNFPKEKELSPELQEARKKKIKEALDNLEATIENLYLRGDNPDPTSFSDGLTFCLAYTGKLVVDQDIYEVYPTATPLENINIFS